MVSGETGVVPSGVSSRAKLKSFDRLTTIIVATTNNIKKSKLQLTSEFNEVARRAIWERKEFCLAK